MRAALCLVVLSVVNAGSWAQSDGPLFPQQFVTAKPSYRSGLHAVDVNADGSLDLITATGNNPGFLTVNLGDGHGFFPETQVTWVGGDPFGIAAGDVDGDGLEDLAISCSIPQQVQIAQGVGDGTFTVSQSIAVGQSPRELVLEDFDGDGDLDLAVVRATAGGVVVALGDGSGGFGPTSTFATAATQADDLAAADLDQDGDPDLVVAFGNLTGLQVLWGDGSGGFRDTAPMLTSMILRDVVVADLTGDQLPDLVGAAAGGGFMQLFVGQGGGSFAPAQSWGPDFGGGAHSLAVADVDGDADLDLAVTTQGSELVGLLLNDGGSTAVLLNVPAGEDNGPLALADVDGDGLVDLLAGSSASDNTDVTVVRNTLDPLFEVHVAVLTPTITEQAMARGDVDGDGSADIVLFGSVGGDNNAVAALENESFAVIAQTVVNVSGTSSQSVWSGDLDGDGRDDVVVPDVSADTLAIVHAQAGGSFGPQVTIPTSIDPTFVVGADVDGDGDRDLVTAHRFQATVAVVWNNGLLGFSAPLVLASATNPDRVAVGDVDEDGFADLVVLHTTVTALSLYRGLGGHAFAAPLSIAVGSSPDDLELTDLDQDGDLDLAVTESNALRVLLGDGSGAFATAATYPVDGIRYLSAGDLDGDGRLDLVASSSTALSVFIGQGDGSFAHAGDFDGDGAPDDLLLDADGDGTLDLVVASGGLQIHWNAADEHGPLAKVGSGLAGSNGTPHWSGLGTLQSQTPLALTLAHAKPGAPLTLVLGTSVLEAPFKGGTMVPQPQLLIAGLAANATGALALSTTWPAGIPSGFLLATQCWIVDPAGPAGLSASNGLVLTAP
jgi:hypothetical protein